MAKMYVEEKTDKIIIASDIRSRLKCFREGALGNYSTAFSVKIRTKSRDIFEVASLTHNAVKKVLENNVSLFLVLACYGEIEAGLLDAAAISALGNYESKAGSFVGSAMFGLSKPVGFSITNLGKIESSTIKTAMFIPPASPAIRKTEGVLTVNGNMIICSSER